MDSIDPGSLRDLPAGEALALLARCELGRIVYSIDGLPAIHPVHYVVDGDRVVFRVAAGSRLRRALVGSVVAFEADDIDVAARTGWTVTVTGTTDEVTDRAEAARLTAALRGTWGSGGPATVVAVRAELVTGRSITSARVPAGR